MNQEAQLDAARQQVAALTRRLEETEQALGEARKVEAALRGELQHRVRNILAVVRSIFSRTADAYETADDIAGHFKGRLDALGRSQTSLLSTVRGGLPLENIVFDELLSVAAAADPRVSVQGPTVHLSGKAAESASLAIHELVTNSIKFGILSQTSGKGALLIQWKLSPQDLSFSWRETGITVLSAAPLRSGFGRDFIENSLPYQVDAETAFAIEPGAIRCNIRLPLSHELVAGERHQEPPHALSGHEP